MYEFLSGLRCYQTWPKSKKVVLAPANTHCVYVAVLCSTATTALKESRLQAVVDFVTFLAAFNDIQCKYSMCKNHYI